MALGQQELLKGTSRSAFHSAPVPAEFARASRPVNRLRSRATSHRRAHRALAPADGSHVSCQVGSKFHWRTSICLSGTDGMNCTPAGTGWGTASFSRNNCLSYGRLTAGYSVQAQTPQPASADRRLGCFKSPELPSMPAPLMHIEFQPVPASGGGRRRHRRRRGGRVHGILSGATGRQCRPAGEGARGRRAVQPQLGLVPPAEPRRARAADGNEEPRSLGEGGAGDRRGYRIPPLRAFLSLAGRERAGRLGKVARLCPDGRRHDAHVDCGGSDRTGQGDRAQVERRSVLANRRNRRHLEGSARCRARHHGGRRHRAPAMRRAGP